MICIIAAVAFGVLGIFSLKYRTYAREAFACVLRRITLRPCESAFAIRMKGKIVGRLMRRSPALARVVYRRFEVLSWAFTVALVFSFAVTGYAIYSLAATGRCPGDICPFAADAYCPVNTTSEVRTFLITEGEICRENGKPVVRMYGTSWCHHCVWVADTFDSVALEYRDRIIARHWQLDVNDDTLTAEHEGTIPDSELAIFRRFNPRGSIPTFVFGCKYYRIGNGYEREGDLAAEADEFKVLSLQF
jgi:thiol-disulfide isomerase/thioredoxin